MKRERCTLSRPGPALSAPVVWAVLFLVAAGGGGLVLGHAASKPLRSPRFESLATGAAMRVVAVQSAALAAAAPADNVAIDRVNVTFAWTRSADASVVGYRFYFGGQTGNYTNRVAVGNTNRTTLPLLRGGTYYAAVTAFDAADKESPFSNEVSYRVPLAPPVNVFGYTVGVRTNLGGARQVLFSAVYTNPPGEAAFFDSQFFVTNNFVTVQRLDASTLRITNTNQP